MIHQSIKVGNVRIESAIDIGAYSPDIYQEIVQANLACAQALTQPPPAPPVTHHDAYQREVLLEDD